MKFEGTFQAISHHGVDFNVSQSPSPTTSAGATSAVAPPYVGVPVGAGVRRYANEVLPTYHAGDVLVSIKAHINGGIGPQRSASTLIIMT